MTQKVFLPKWMGWFTTIIIVPLWLWITYEYVFGVGAAREELGLVGYLIISFVLIISVVITWLMALGKLPAYIIKEKNEKEENQQNIKS